MAIAGDSGEYDILKKACTYVKGDNLLTCEIGVREGLGSQIILEAFIIHQLEYMFLIIGRA